MLNYFMSGVNLIDETIPVNIEVKILNSGEKKMHKFSFSLRQYP